MPEAVISSQQKSEVISSYKRPGLKWNWGIRAWIDYTILALVLVKNTKTMVSDTYLPVLKLCSPDPDKVTRQYEDMLARREKRKLFDSPRERWRKLYGSFIRESEWALLELRKYLSKEDYEELVIGTGAYQVETKIPGIIAWFNNIRLENAEKNGSDDREERGNGKSSVKNYLKKFIIGIIDPGVYCGFLIGESKTTMDLEKGVTFEIDDCAWHSVGDMRDLPVPNQIPEQGCQMICKGICERVFNGESAVRIDFDPHLPEKSCTFKVEYRRN